jgi:hypothetical protein
VRNKIEKQKIKARNRSQAKAISEKQNKSKR